MPVTSREELLDNGIIIQRLTSTERSDIIYFVRFPTDEVGIINSGSELLDEELRELLNGVKVSEATHKWEKFLRGRGFKNQYEPVEK